MIRVIKKSEWKSISPLLSCFNHCDIYCDTYRSISNINIKNSWFIFILNLKQWQHYFIHMMSWYWDEIVNIQKFLLSMVFYIFNLERPLITYRLTFSIRELFLLYISPSLPNFFLLHNQGFFISLSVLFWVLMMLI